MLKEHLGIKINPAADEILSEQSRLLLKNYYMRPDEDSPQEAFARAATAYCQDDMELAQRIYDYASKGWFMFASPVLSNAPLPGEKVKALPISCFLTYVPDTIEGLLSHTSELRWLSVMGGGVGGHWSDVRSVSNIAPGPIPFMHTVDADMQAYKQGTTRKGAYAAYMDVSHPDIEEFINIRVPTGGGDINRKAFNLHNAVNITDDFMDAVLHDQPWNLVDPKDQSVRKTLSARKLWETMLTTRYRTGEPYLYFIDTARKAMPQPQKDLGLTLNGSNLCIEITLATSKQRSAVCCLSSSNLRKYREWKGTTFIQDLVRYLDNVLQFFIDHAPDSISRARYSAERERSLGLGGFGWHALLQSEQIPFESAEALALNEEVFGYIQSEALKSSHELGEEKGCYPDSMEWIQKIYPNSDELPILTKNQDKELRRNAHIIAIAPNANSASLAGTSPSVELWRSNAFVHDTRAGAHLIKNPELESYLESIGRNTEEVWNKIVADNGSVQKLKFLSDEMKAVFKTAIEIDQHWVIAQAAARQKYVCQSQSINLYFPSGADKAYINSVHLQAYKQGLKSLYYLRTEKSNKVEAVGDKVERVALIDHKEPETAEECTSCHA